MNIVTDNFNKNIGRVNSIGIILIVNELSYRGEI